MTAAMSHLSSLSRSDGEGVSAAKRSSESFGKRKEAVEGYLSAGNDPVIFASLDATSPSQAIGKRSGATTSFDGRVE